MNKRQKNTINFTNYIAYSRSDEQKDLIHQVINYYSLGKIHKTITVENLIKKILNTKASRKSAIKAINKLETKEPVNKIVYKTNYIQQRLNQFITIEERESALDGMECIEQPNVEVLDKLLESDLLNTQVYTTKKNDINTTLSNFQKNFSKTYETEKKHLQAYRKKVSKDGKVIVKYEKLNSMKFGRVYMKDYLGAITIRKEIRGSLFYDKYVDLDMSNCHPNIYYQIAKLYNIECPTLESYILKRDTILKEIMDYYKVEKWVAKVLLITLLYLGGFKSWAIEHNIKKPELPFIRKIKKELNTIADKIILNNPLLVEKVSIHLKKKRKPYTPHKLKCSVISYFNQEIECRILEQIYLYCVSRGYIKNNVCCLCYDGIMILIEHYHEGILNEFNNVIYNVIGLQIKFEKKEMEHYLDILDDHIKIKDTIIIDQRYLLDQEKLLNDETLFTQNVNKFLEDTNIKSLNIKSPYDTGKTQLLKSIIRDKYQDKKVLMITYRVTLAYEFESVFSEFNFNNYKSGNFDSEFLINQTESLLRLVDKKKVLPKYDLIIIDEVESVLNQFKSPTFKGKSANTFELLIALCNNPTTKFITLDGDMSDRSFTFINYFGKSMNIKNICNFNNKTINMYMQSKDALIQFENKMIDDLHNNLRLVIPTMSSVYAYETQKKINDMFPTKKVIIYTSVTSDKEKQDIKGLIELWQTADVVIYTPTIEAGVSFDVPGHFDKLYGYMCVGSCSQRSYKQMLSRVRKFNTTEFNIYSNQKLENGKSWTYEEIETNSLYPKDLVLRNEYVHDDESEETKIVLKNDLYRQIYIHNTVEEKNKHSKAFMSIFFEIATTSGYTINIVPIYKDCDEDDDAECGKKKVKKLLTKYTDILDAVDIDRQVYYTYIKLQKQGNATKDQKLSIQKFLIKSLVGIDNLNYDDYDTKVHAYDIVKTYVDSSTLNNLIGLIDETQIKDKDEIKEIEKNKLISYVKTIINKLGFNNCCDKKKIDKETFTKTCYDACIYLSDMSKDLLFNQICNQSKDDLEYLKDAPISSQMRKLNIILNRCGIKVSCEHIGKDKITRKNIDVYRLDIIDYLDEIISNKLTYQPYKFHRINDKSGLFPKVELNYFKPFITNKPIEKIDANILDDQLLDDLYNNL